MKKQRRYCPWFRRIDGCKCPATGYEIREVVPGGYEIFTPDGHALLGDALSREEDLPMLKQTAHSEYLWQKSNAA